MGKNSSKVAKRALKGPKIRISAISQQLWLYRAPKIGKYWEPIGTISLEKVSRAIESVKLTMGAKGAKIAVE